MNTRAKAFFSLILVLLVGIIIGGAVDHLYVSKFSPPDRSDSRERRPSNRKFPMQEMIERLKLNPDQEKQLHSILERTREAMHEADKSARETHSALRKRAGAEIRAMLTEEQSRQYDEFMKELRSRRRQRKEESNESPPASKRPK